MHPSDAALIAVTQSSDLPNRTIAPLLRLFTLPLITLPPPPKIDKYGINTIPELPPQHESIYEGMFAPDGSLNKINNSTKKDAKETETNRIHDQNGLQRSDESLRDIRAADIRIADGPVVNDDYHWYADEENIRNREENMIVTKFLRDNIPNNKNNARLQLAEDISYDDKLNTSLESNLFSSNDIAIEITTTETVEPNVKSSTVTRLQVLISDENDTPAKKYGNFELASKTEDGKPHRIFPRSDQSPIRVNPVPQHSENGTIIHFSIWQKHKNRTLHRTTIQPNVHFVIHDGEIDRNEVVTLSTIKSKSAPRANLLPKEEDEFVLQQDESEEGSNNLVQKLQSMNLISQKLHEKVHSI
ncbi:hypothetical protein DINM_006587 [Dirofilaria immitis]|nr:hypothetical protein [Dirofilaria immitis]